MPTSACFPPSPVIPARPTWSLTWSQQAGWGWTSRLDRKKAEETKAPNAEIALGKFNWYSGCKAYILGNKRSQFKAEKAVHVSR